jgi:hypothetical protein
MEPSDGKPVSQMFADDLKNLITKYNSSGIENSQVIGVLHMAIFNLESDVREAIINSERPY